MRQAILQLKKDDTSDEASRSLRSATGKLLQIAAKEQQTLPSESSHATARGDAAEWSRAASKLIGDELKWFKGKSNSSALKTEKSHGNLYAEFLKLNRKVIGAAPQPPGITKHPDFGTSSGIQQLIKERLGIRSRAQLRQRADYSLEMRLRNDTKDAEQDRFDSWTRPERWDQGGSRPIVAEAGMLAGSTKRRARMRDVSKRPRSSTLLHGLTCLYS